MPDRRTSRKSADAAGTTLGLGGACCRAHAGALRWISVVAFCLLLGVSSSALAASIFDLTYEGRITDPTGKPFQGTFALQIDFYHEAEGGEPVLTIIEGLGAVPLSSGGIFQAKVSLSSEDFAKVFPDVSQPVYLAFTDLTHSAGQPLPRQQVMMLPYAGKVPVDGKTVRFGSDGKLTAAPRTRPKAGEFLTMDASGEFSWASPFGSSVSGSGVSGGPTPSSPHTKGRDLVLSAGNGTGNGGSGSIVLQTAAPVAGGGATTADSLAMRMVIDPSGNMGIGTASPLAKLNVAGGSAFITGDSGMLTPAAGAGLALKYYSDQAHIFGYDYGTISPKNLILQSPGGNVGIGSTAPTAKVDIDGDLKVSGLMVEKTVTFTPTKVGWYRIVTAWRSGGTIRISAMYDNSDTDLEFQYYVMGWGQNGSIQETKFGFYNWGVVSQARISSDNAGNGYLDIYVAKAASPGPIMIYGYGPRLNGLMTPVVDAVAGPNNVFTLTFGNGFRTTSDVTAGGSVGIGTSSPGAALDIRSGTNNDGHIRLGSAGQAGKINFARGDGNYAASIGYPSATESNEFRFSTGSGGGYYSFFTNFAGAVAERFRIDYTGNVGIGTTNPNAKLYVGDGTSTDVFSLIGGKDSSNTALTFGGGIWGGAGAGNRAANSAWIGAITNHSLALRTNNNDSVVISAAGNVGIGTTSPFGTLDVRGAIVLPNSNWGTRPAVGTSPIAGEISGLNTSSGADAGFLRLSAGGSSAGAAAKSWIDISGYSPVSDMNQNIVFGTGSERMRITMGGNVGIGTSSPSYTLHVVGTAGLSTGTAWTNASDLRLKDIDGDYEYGLEEIKRLHTVRFRYKRDNPLQLPSDHRMTGFIAQEVQDVIPEAVHQRADGYLELNVDPIHWATVNAVKELAAENAQLRQRADRAEAESVRLRTESERLRTDSERLRTESERLNERLEGAEAEAQRLRQETSQLKAAFCAHFKEARLCSE